MKHRGARAADGRTGDGAGLLCETPRKLLARDLARVDLQASSSHLAAICLFLPPEPEAAAAARAAIEARVHNLDIVPLRWRTPVTHDDVLGAQARTTRPLFEQLVVDMGPGNVRERMRTAAGAIEKALREFGRSAALLSCSATSVVYKALLSSDELGAYFDDLRDPSFASRFALFHQRFSTNSSPSWRLVQPFRHIAHNGEINTITGNRAWMNARGIATVPGVSDSYDFNTNLDAMVGAGYRVDDAVDILLAPAIGMDEPRLRAYYDAHLPTVEPWDGPAAMVFADGDTIGAALDRTGLRPLRYCRTASQKVLCASESRHRRFRRRSRYDARTPRPGGGGSSFASHRRSGRYRPVSSGTPRTRGLSRGRAQLAFSTPRSRRTRRRRRRRASASLRLHA